MSLNQEIKPPVGFSLFFVILFLWFSHFIVNSRTLACTRTHTHTCKSKSEPAQSAGAVEYTDCISAGTYDPTLMIVLI